MDNRDDPKPYKFMKYYMVCSMRLAYGSLKPLSRVMVIVNLFALNNKIKGILDLEAGKGR